MQWQREKKCEAVSSSTSVEAIMRAFAVSIDLSSSSLFLQFSSSATTYTNLALLPYKFTSFTSLASSTFPTKSFLSKIRPTPHCSTAEPNSFNGVDFDEDVDDSEDDDEYYSFSGEDSDSVAADGVLIEIKKLGKNSRRIRSKIAINSSLEAIWSLLTDYERLADFIPGLAVSKLIEKKDKFARLCQIGQQKLPLGLKFNAKVILDCYEKDLETSSYGRKRDIEFKMIEGDLQFFEGKWSIEQLNTHRPEDGDFETTLSYFVDVKPKLWLPVHLVEGILCKEIKTNLSCIREEAQKVIQDGLHA